MKYSELSNESLSEEKKRVLKKFNELRGKNLRLDMSRGKPNSSQLDITAKLFSNIDVYTKRVYQDGLDLGNYGILSGIKEAKQFFADLLDTNEENVIMGGNSSLNLMFDMFAHSMIFGNQDSEKPWCKLEKVKFLCPSPGYDRHFAICEKFDIEMITIDINEEGPDMDTIESLVKEDDSIKGIWCVPLYSNPDGFSYKPHIIERLSKMETKAKDFRIFWDNAYAVHHLYSDKNDEIENIIDLCKKNNNENRPYVFASTSKISFPGAGISALCTSPSNVKDVLSRMQKQTIGYDKLNMIRHVLALKNKDGVMEHMKKMAEVNRPKFEIVLNKLDEEIAPLEIARWNKPLGGYFIGFYAMEGCAKEIVSLCKEAGVVLTGAGATYPYKKDPKDSNIRIAPTYPKNDDLKQAMEVFVVCVKLATLSKLIEGSCYGV